MSRYITYLLGIVLWLGLTAAAFAAGSNVNSMTASGAIVGTQLFYCPIGATTDLKCTAAQIAAYNYLLASGDCTATGAGVLTCTKTNSVAFSPLATLVGSTAGDLAYYNGTTWTRFPGNTGASGFLSESSAGVPSWAAGSSSITFNTTCPSSSNSGSTITFTNNLPQTAETANFTTSCGVAYHATLSAAATATIPVTAGNVSFISNDASSTFPLILSPASGLIDGKASELLSPGQMVTVWSNDGVNVATDLNGYVANVGYVSGRWFPGVGISGTTGGNMGAGNVSCTPYIVSPPGVKVKAIGAFVTTTDTSATGYVWLGIYANANGVPGAKIDDVGTTAITAPATSANPISATLVNGPDNLGPGAYWTCGASPSTSLVLQGLTVTSAYIIGGSTINAATNASNTGITGYFCTGGSTNCGPTWTTGSAYTGATTLVGATMSARSNGTGAPNIVLQVN